MAGKLHPFFADTPSVGQRKNLVASAIGEEGPLPLHERMQPPRFFEQIRPRPQVQVVGIAQDNPGPYAVLEFIAAQTFDRTQGPNGHEEGGLDHTVRRLQEASPATASFVFGLKEKTGRG